MEIRVLQSGEDGILKRLDLLNVLSVQRFVTNLAGWCLPGALFFVMFFTQIDTLFTHKDCGK